MIVQLAIGSAAVILSVLVQAVFVGLAIIVLTRLGAWFTTGATGAKLIATLVFLTLWMLAGISAAVWIWAGLYLWLGVFSEFEAALYFSTVAFTTLGFGDITLDENWRLTSSLMAANGLIIFSLSTAFLIEAIRRIDHARSL